MYGGEVKRNRINNALMPNRMKKVVKNLSELAHIEGRKMVVVTTTTTRKRLQSEEGEKTAKKYEKSFSDWLSNSVNVN